MLRINGLSVIAILIVVLIAVLLIIGCIGFTNDDPPEGIDVVEEVWSIILDDFVGSEALDDEALTEAAIRGLLESLEDPYTVYLDPEYAEISREELEGGITGIGAAITIRDNMLTVVMPLDSSPAEKAGIKSGDKILEVDGESTLEMSLVEAMLKIRGEEGTKVKLSVLHMDEETPVYIEIVREKIDVPSVYFEMIADDIAHISITSFTGRTDSEFEASLSDALEQGSSGIILDLRNNYGGLVDSAVNVVSEFVEEGIVVYAMDNEEARRDWSMTKGGIALDISLVVLTNANSASASEVVAGALQDYDRATLIGTTTYGKGSMQHVLYLSNGGALHVTFAKWYTPDGRQIHDKGIDPDIEVEVTSEDIENGRDPQLERAITFLTEGS
ncbi:MAG: S41 family peptidase [Chloroflexi bacterium]|nr:S41 family peptidase [Chloroflexota bacterium]